MNTNSIQLIYWASDRKAGTKQTESPELPGSLIGFLLTSSPVLQKSEEAKTRTLAKEMFCAHFKTPKCSMYLSS